MSDDRENEYFSDGMTEEILNALVRVKEFDVASRTSSLAIKESRQNVREIAEKLSVATVLEGGVRKAGNRLRITAQLIDVDEGYHPSGPRPMTGRWGTSSRSRMTSRAPSWRR